MMLYRPVKVGFSTAAAKKWGGSTTIVAPYEEGPLIASDALPIMLETRPVAATEEV